MRLLLDVCAASRTLQSALVSQGHDVVSARDRYSRASDEALLALAHSERRVLVTEDKDFGELVFLRRLPHPCIVRLVGLRVTQQAEAPRDLIARHSTSMSEGAIIVVTPSRVRIRSTSRDDISRGQASVEGATYGQTPQAIAKAIAKPAGAVVISSNGLDEPWSNPEFCPFPRFRRISRLPAGFDPFRGRAVVSGLDSAIRAGFA